MVYENKFTLTWNEEVKGNSASTFNQKVFFKELYENDCSSFDKKHSDTIHYKLVQINIYFI